MITKIVQLQHYLKSILIVSILFTTVWAQSGNREFDYGPRYEPKDIRVLKSTPCILMAETAFVFNTDEVIRAQCGKDEITITGIEQGRKNSDDEKTTTHVRIQIKRSLQSPLSTTIRESEFPADFVDSVSTLDLNGDEKPEYIIDLSSHGNGLAANIGGVVVLLSRNDGYQYMNMGDLIMNPNRFIQYKKNATTVMVTERLIQHRSHDYFLFDLIRFPLDSHRGVASANKLDSRFPFWTRYTDKPTHMETDRLSPSTKRALWHDPVSQMHFGRFKK
jgi:hypothetical protein